MHSKDNILKFLFFFVILIVEIFGNLQTNLLISACAGVFLLVNREQKVSKHFLIILSLLGLVFIIGFAGFIFKLQNLYTFIKDIIFFIKPIAFLSLGYFFVKGIKDKKFIFNLIITVALILAIYHISIVSYFVGTTGNLNINSIRNYSGKANIIEMLAILVLINKNSFLFLKNVFLRFKYLFLILLIASFILYFSRNMLVSIFIMGLAMNGYFRLSLKRMKAFFSIILVLGLSYSTLFLFDIKRDAEGIEGFFYKLKIAPTELVTDDKIDKNTSHDILWDKWRGYESKLALSQTTNGFFSFFIGNSFGSLVDLKFEAPLGDENMRFIPIIHSGYLFVFFKTGLIGLCCYALFIIYLINFANHKIINNYSFLVTNMVVAFGAYYFLSSITITGVYNIEDSFTLFLGGFLGMYHYFKNHELNAKSYSSLNLNEQ